MGGEGKDVNEILAGVGNVEPLTLLIDVKRDSEATYVVLDALLRRYADLFTISAGGEVIDGPVVAIISGERAIGTLLPT